MDKKNLTTILAVVLIAAFFLPYIAFGEFSLSGFKIIFGKEGLLTGKGNLLWITLLVPIGAVLILLGSLGADNSLRSTGYIFWMPLVGILYLAVRMYLEMSKGASAVGGSMSVGDFLSVMGYGFWITLAASIGILVNQTRSEYATR